MCKRLPNHFCLYLQWNLVDFAAYNHSVEIPEIFCYSRFYVKSILDKLRVSKMAIVTTSFSSSDFFFFWQISGLKNCRKIRIQSVWSYELDRFWCLLIFWKSFSWKENARIQPRILGPQCGNFSHSDFTWKDFVFRFCCWCWEKSQFSETDRLDFTWILRGRKYPKFPHCDGNVLRLLNT